MGRWRDFGFGVYICRSEWVGVFMPGFRNINRQWI
jgi:hypothetical protein